MTSKTTRWSKAPLPELEQLDISVRWSKDGQVGVHVAGRSPLRRANLWTMDEHWSFDNPVYGPYDFVSHLVLAMAQDRPNTLDRALFSLNGGLSIHQAELFPDT